MKTNLSESFLSELKDVLNYSENTVKSYENDLNKLFLFLSEHDMDVTEMVYEDAREFSLSLYQSRISRSSINRILSTCRHFFHYLCEVGVMDSDPFKRIHNASVLRTIPTVLSESEINSVIHHPYTDYTSLMEVTMFNIFFSTGCRLSEVINMTCSCLDLNRRRALITGKGKKQRFVFFSEDCVGIISEYLRQREILLMSMNLTDQDILLVNKKGKQLPLSTVHIIFDKYGRNLGFTKKFTPHVFRHTFATVLMDNEMDIKLIKDLLGHKSIGTTQIYTHVSRKRLEDVYRRSHPHALYAGDDFGGENEL